MNHPRNIRLASAALLVVAMMAALQSCSIFGGEEKDFDSALLAGYWQEQGTEQYYHYFANGTGKFWDEAEDVEESDVVTNGNGYFTWTLEKSKLTLNFTIEINQGGVPKVNTLETLTSSTLAYKDSSKKLRTLNRVNR